MAFENEGSACAEAVGVAVQTGRASRVALGNGSICVAVGMAGRKVQAIHVNGAGMVKDHVDLRCAADRTASIVEPGIGPGVEAASIADTALKVADGVAAVVHASGVVMCGQRCWPCWPSNRCMATS